MSIGFVHNTPPVFDFKREWLITESEPVGSRVITVRTRDAERDPITYAIEPAVYLDGSQFFTINARTGDVFLKESLLGKVSVCAAVCERVLPSANMESVMRRRKGENPVASVAAHTYSYSALIQPLPFSAAKWPGNICFTRSAQRNRTKRRHRLPSETERCELQAHDLAFAPRLPMRRCGGPTGGPASATRALSAVRLFLSASARARAAR